MELAAVVVIAALAVALAPVGVRVFDRAAGWPLAGLLAIAAVILARALPEIISGEPLTYRLVWAKDVLGPGADVALSLHADTLSALFGLLALVIGAVVFVYSAAYLPKGRSNTSFYTLMTAFTASILLLVFAGDVLVLFVAWELVSLASFMLIARSGSSGEAGAQRTLILTFFGGLTLLAALAIAAVTAGSTDLNEILASPAWENNPQLTALVAVLVAVSAFTKSAQFPFHFWLPEAMAAATPVSAFLHAAAVVKAGVYVLLRFSTIFADVTAWNLLLVIVGMGTAFVSALFAIQKTDLKHLTAYSTVSHLGWIVATIGIGTPVALTAALVHTLAHALFKSSLFMLIGVVDHEAGSRDIRRLGPLWRKMPCTFVATVIAALSMAAVPPLFGFLSKESMLTAFTDAPLGSVGTAVLLAVAGVAALLTFLYSAKIVFGTFFDGPRPLPNVHEAPVSLWLPAALPGVMSIPLAFAAPVLDTPFSAAVNDIAAPTDHHVHLALWHGITTPLLITVAVLVVGTLALFARRRIFAAAESRDLLPATGNDVLHGLNRFFSRCGRWLAGMADTLNPSRHVLWIVVLIIALGTVTTFATSGIDGVTPAPRAEGLEHPLDLVPLLLIAASVAGLAFSRSRLTGAVLIGTVGVGMSLQMLLLGAPDVALTQFLVEALTVIVIMLVIRHQPIHFPTVAPRRKLVAGILAVAAGLTAFAGTVALLGRRDRSELAMWYLDNAPDVTGGSNIVAVIIVEFRGFDTLGELSVLGMGAVVLAALVSTMPRYPFSRGLHPAPFGQSQLNSLPLRKVTVLVIPVLMVLSVLIFFRGHTAPGGGFVAALVLATAFGLSYMSKGSDRPVVGRTVPLWLTGIGIIVAIASGFLGLIEGGFLYALHGEILGEHLTTSLIFDGGIYLTVLGMLTMAINALGGYLRPGVSYLEDLNYVRGDGEKSLVPGLVGTTETDEDYPEPINPADAPRSVLARGRAKAASASGSTPASELGLHGKEDA
ncbi:cation:proton antiporter [Corynebacterium yudongzhengii]|uniref:DUF4040 domain-containing protein n=1 Tax=Corynebacterium yudongzhengii TaxID=2080740 RepID=A0A2U1T5G8_9CORY|nr:DUF4040 family protein [Corynebacterium yudongzhengii]AWB81074.1 cation:proton antiporter [Corynebacterium yudongzhengii]PWC01233.1 DUF4040 domain-containing protein [Corynebacterium yudongzhengii]